MQSLQGLLLQRFDLNRHDIGAAGGFVQRTGVGGIGFVAFHIGPDIRSRQQLDRNPPLVEPATLVMGRAASFHDDQSNVPVLEAALELAARQPLLPNNIPLVIGHGNLEYILGQINRHGSSMYFGLLSSKTDPHPHEHRLRLFGDEKTGESIPSAKRVR